MSHLDTSSQSTHTVQPNPANAVSRGLENFVQDQGCPFNRASLGRGAYCRRYPKSHIVILKERVKEKNESMRPVKYQHGHSYTARKIIRRRKEKKATTIKQSAG
jgi:hypothetical protein